jgi:hypothetical protein
MPSAHRPHPRRDTPSDRRPHPRARPRLRVSASGAARFVGRLRRRSRRLRPPEVGLPPASPARTTVDLTRERAAGGLTRARTTGGLPRSPEVSSLAPPVARARAAAYLPSSRCRRPLSSHCSPSSAVAPPSSSPMHACRYSWCNEWMGLGRACAVLEWDGSRGIVCLYRLEILCCPVSTNERKVHGLCFFEINESH